MKIVEFDGLPVGVTIQTENVLIIGTQTPKEKEEKESA